MCTREKLANLCHEQWSGWMEYLFSKCFAEVGQFDKDTGNLIIPEWAVNRWRRQMRTPYAELPENDKESDRKEADRFLAILFSDGNQVAKNELAELRAELEKLKRQWAEDDRDITELEDENNQLRAELEKAKKATNQQAINALKLAYRKHCLSDASIGWIELEDILRDALCEAIGDKAFQQFLITWEE
jgi:hypothetical protein